MNGIEDEVIDESKDLSRPYFPRNPGEIGVYVDVDDAIPLNVHAYGSAQLMRVEMNDTLGEEMSKRDLVKVKGELERRGQFRGVVLEEFRKGATLAVTFDNLADLIDVWHLHEGKQLSLLFQAIFADKAMRNALSVRKLTLRVRLWQDEYDKCRGELKKMAKDGTRVDIRTRPRDMELLKQVKEAQKQQAPKLYELHVAEAHFDRHLSEFLLVVKRTLPQHIDRLPNLKEFTTTMTVAMGTKSAGMESVKKYLSTLELVRTMIAQAEANIYLPLLLIPARCESENQRQVKLQMKDAIAEMTRLLKPTTSLKEANFKEWERKVLPKERTLFMGLISLVPLGAEKVSDVDRFLDEYVTGFPS